MSNKIIVIGSNSFSGSSFCSYLLKKGVEVIGISRSKEKDIYFLPYKWIPQELQNNFTFYKYDLNTNTNEILQLVLKEKPRLIFNFSAQSMVGESWEYPEDWMNTNIVALSKLIKNLKNLDFLDKYIHISTPEVYGDTNGWIDESTVYNPSTPYAVSRAAGDMICKIYNEQYDFPFVSTRAANVYGPGQQLYRIIPRTIFCILNKIKLDLHGGGSSIRSFIHIEDVNNATFKLAYDKNAIGNFYHISTDSIVSIRELVSTICSLLHVDFETSINIVNERVGKDSAYCLNSNKIRSNFSWRDNINLEEGILETVDWVKNNMRNFKINDQIYVHKK